MRGLLRRLKCDNYKTLVAASSIIRPVAQSGMMREYIFRITIPVSLNIFILFSSSNLVKPTASWFIRKM
jgi:hypothetical protein